MMDSMDKNFNSKVNSRARGLLKREIDEAKDDARLAYVLGARKKAGEILSQEELDFIEEQDVNRKVLAKLEDIFSKLSVNRPREELVGDRELFAVMRFFYLVRLTQQGLFHLISNVYPTIEPHAITYLADRLIESSFGEGRINPVDDSPCRRFARKLSRKLYGEVNEPIADGYKTTFKDIMRVANHLGTSANYDSYKKRSTEQRHEQPEQPVSVAQTSTAAAAIPPIWVIMPYTNMTNNSNFTMPTIDPTLPVPGFLIHPTPPQQPATQQPAIQQPATQQPATQQHTTNEISTKSKKKRNNKNSKKRDADKTKESVDEAQDTEEPCQETDQEEVSDEINNNENATHEHVLKETPAVEPDTKAQSDLKQEEEDNEDDRFADADLSDDDDDVINDKSNQHNVNNAAKETEKTELKPVNGTPSSTSTSTKKEPALPSQWQNFAASCNADEDGSETPLSSIRSSPRVERKKQTI